MSDDKEKNWLDKIGDTVVEAIEDLLTSAAEGVIGITPEPIKEIFGEAVETFEPLLQIIEPPLRTFQEQVAEPIGKSLMGYGGGFPWLDPGGYQEKLEQYREEVPSWARFGAEIAPYMLPLPGGSALRAVGTAAKLPWLARAGLPTKMPGMVMPSRAAPAVAKPRIPTAPTERAMMPEGVRVRAGLEGAETAGMTVEQIAKSKTAWEFAHPTQLKFRNRVLSDLTDAELYEFQKILLEDWATSASPNIAKAVERLDVALIAELASRRAGTILPVKPPRIPPTAITETVTTPPARPAGMPPVKPPEVPPAVVAPEPIPLKFKRIKLPELQNLEAAIDDQFGYMTGKLTQLTQRASQLPGFKQVMQQANPSVLAKDPHMRAVYSHAGIRQSGGSGSVYISSVLRTRYGDAVKAMGIDDAGRCFGIKGEPYIGDVMTWPKKFPLTPQQREFVDAVSDIMRQRLARLQEKNIPIRVLNKIEETTGEVYGLELLGGKYFPRIYTGYRGAEPRALGLFPRKLKAKPPQMKERGWPTMKQGVEQGNIQYVADPIETVERTLNAAYRLEADYGLVDFLKTLPGVRTVKGTLIAEHSPLLAQRLTTRDSWRVFASAKNALARAKAGGKVPQNTLDAIRRSHPALADDIVRIMETPRPRPRALLAEIDSRFKQTSDRVLAELKDVNNRYRNVKASAAKLREGEGAVLNQHAFQGTILPQNVADDLTRYLNDNGFTIGRWTTTLNHMAIGLQTTVDFGFWMIQGLVLATRHPTIWTRNIKSSLEVLASPKVYGKILEEKAPIVQQMIKARAAPLSGAEFTQFMRTGPLTKVPILRNVFRRFTGMFDAYIDIGRVYLWEAKMVGANKKSANALRDLADHVDKMLGVSSSERIGLSATRRQVESSFVFYAPRWRRAVYGFIADAMQGGWRGAEARKALTALMVGGASIYTAVSLALDQEPNFDPRTGRFMTVKVGDSHIGLGTPYVALWRLAGNTWRQISEDPEAFVTFEEGTDHAFARYVRSSISPVAGVLWDVVEGKNFIGEQVNRDLQNVGREAAETLLPFWASEYAQAAIEGQEMPGGELAMGEFMGMRAWPVQAWEERQELRNKLAQEARGVDWYSPDMLQKDRNALYAGSPELQQLDKEILERKIQTGDPPEIVDDWLRAYIKQGKYNAREQLADDVLTGKKELSQYSFLNYGISRFYSGMYEATNLLAGFLDEKGQAEYEKWHKEHTHPWDLAVEKYYDFEDTEERERYLLSLSTQVRAHVTYMVEEDWKLYLGPNAQRVQQFAGQGTTGGGSDFRSKMRELRGW